MFPFPKNIKLIKIYPMNNKIKFVYRLLILFLVFTDCQPKTGQSEKEEALIDSQSWQWGPFIKIDSLNPILTPSEDQVFLCPIQKDTIRWEEKDVFNPAAIFHEGKIYMLYRAEDQVGKFAGTSRLGLAVSEDGMHFKKHKNPVFFPDNDFMKIFEWEGGCEDPRIVESEEGKYVLTYTTWDGTTARLAVASSMDLIHWEKHGLVFGKYKNQKYRDLWSKSGSIICKKSGNKLIAAKVNGKYWMYWGDTNIYLAKSSDLIFWEPVEENDGSLKVVFGPREGYFDSNLVEPGPPAILTDQGILLIYNSRNIIPGGDPDIPDGTYTAGQILLDLKNPPNVIARSEKNFFKPENDYEIQGQVGNVCFLEALVPFNDRWFLYYGTADSYIAVAIFTNVNE